MRRGADWHVLDRRQESALGGCVTMLSVSISLMKTKLIFAVMVFCVSVASAADLPEPVMPAGMGVNIHFVKGHERDLDLISAAGFKFIRMDFGWGDIERRKDEYDWSAYDELTANL